jgi:alpha-galactosidase
MPWYFAATAGPATHCYGVRTGAAAFCSWAADPDGITLTADVRSGSTAVQLGERVLAVCEVVCRPGRAGESAFAALHAFCRQMCAAPRLPAYPVYGSNDWYWAYGNNSAASVRADAQRVVDLSPTGANRPFVVIDDGWQPEGGRDKNGAGLWDRGNEKFPDLPGLAADVRRTGGRAGIWIRALQAPADAPASWRLPRDRTTLDPTVPDVLHKVTTDINRLREWGFELIKHDYSTFDIMGRWGSQMGSTMTRDGWTFAAGSGRATAEVIDTFYATIAAAAGDSLVIGCNTVSHLSAGHFALCRVGDDTSGTDWSRVRKMGVNSLAFRGAQHGAFYVADADCVGVTTQLPWSLNRQWLDVLAASGTTLFVSLAPDAIGEAQRRDLQRALALAATHQPLGEPLDWQRTVSPESWRLRGRAESFDWIGADGGLGAG